MSAISEKVRTALYSKLNVSGVTTLATGGIFHKIAPQTASYPFVTFQRISSNVSYTLNKTMEIEDDLWMVKASADEDSSTTKEPQGLCEEILAACETALGSSLTLSGATNQDLRRTGDIPELVEVINDREIHTHGFLLRLASN